MPATFIRKGEWVTVTNHELFFAVIEDGKVNPHAGYGFECDENGVLTRAYPVESWDEAHNPATHRPMGMRTWTHRYWEPAVIKCACGAKVSLPNTMTNTCEACGRDYNSGGQLLAPRSQWGEETGESLMDILQANRRIGGDW